MDSIVSKVVFLILVLGLISYAILGQVSGVKDTGDKATIEQAKINQMISSSDVVTGSTVRNYVNVGNPVSALPEWNESDPDRRLQVLVRNRDNDGSLQVVSTGTKEDIKVRVKEGSIYTVKKGYSPEGALWTLVFEQEDMSNN